eukprot:CAMPEP_0183360456 /NCGR_PEP_ID=MMETSP0164_2-20130417/55236_1 /TAXON_ID=221442 /ORGANISM="Coccolithus pelagicus ssp braarudi, Strain PLY182g" /LENGTH=214 /DNA_ID=CAMNT_0025534819 /DNA_START=29 /DNA_END=674 /DNA_ORIENTATION=+
MLHFAIALCSVVNGPAPCTHTGLPEVCDAPHHCNADNTRCPPVTTELSCGEIPHSARDGKVLTFGEATVRTQPKIVVTNARSTHVAATAGHFARYLYVGGWTPAGTTHMASAGCDGWRTAMCMRQRVFECVAGTLLSGSGDTGMYARAAKRAGRGPAHRWLSRGHRVHSAGRRMIRQKNTSQEADGAMFGSSRRERWLAHDCAHWSSDFHHHSK